ncbi:hypothetical protein Mycch_1639 [Mycolicibacterium chubuense NBB4]|uniref:DUF1214 domain-containing protein n=1 Tax=Mycolicibacterium chubuense (strain NBB4) TaxID=710421 RepID=I4BGM9_MYCCN|nr:DUF1214 domain-containing protein [Mycolicibacterium chubuense]AFM16436.1 hypothetical protein Mycch_1639 [Mycolicibacterium chubuense NBB4]
MSVILERHGHVIGRVGGLAVALGIGVALANGSGVATAEDGASSPASSSSSQSSSRQAPSKAARGNRETRETRETKTPRARHADSPRDDDRGHRFARRTQVAVSSTPRLPRTPAVPATSPSQWVMAGAARRELGTETVAAEGRKAAVATAATDDSAAQVTSPLGTPQQLEAEQLAAETVRTWPVRLMTGVLRLGWQATAKRQYQQIGGPDSANLAQLRRSVDEYAMAAAFQQQLLDPMAPTVVAQVAPPHTWFGQQVAGSRILYDNPDTVYRFMGVNKTSTYVITGRFTGEMPADTTFSVLTGLSGTTAAVLSAGDLQIGSDGSFTITVSGDPAAPGQVNHLQLTSDSTLIAVRNTLSDWNSQPPMELAIERVSGPRDSLFSQLGGFAIPLIGPAVTNSRLLTTLVSLVPAIPDPPPILRGTVTALVMALGLSREAKYIKVATTDPQTGEIVAPNELPEPSRNAEFLATQLQSAGYFQLADTKALVVTVDPGSAGYFVVPVTNLWTITDDYWDQQTSLNNAQAVANPDGTYTIVITPTDPGVRNWVSTGGLNQGTISIRFQDVDPASADLPTVSAQVVALDHLGSVLPPQSQYVTAAERQDQLARRKAGFDVRFAPFPQ